VNPITGKVKPWQMSRLVHHCGLIAAAAHTLLFRSWDIACYDLLGDFGTVHFEGQRRGCHINFIGANGLLLIPEASSGCMCPFPILCTVAFKERSLNREWGTYSCFGAPKPVKRLSVNLGAPGDRRSKDGTLWLAYPRPFSGRLSLPLDVKISFLPGMGYSRKNEDLMELAGSLRAGLRPQSVLD